MSSGYNYPVIVCPNTRLLSGFLGNSPTTVGPVPQYCATVIQPTLRNRGVGLNLYDGAGGMRTLLSSTNSIFFSETPMDTIDITADFSGVTLSSVGTGVSLVKTATGPNLELKGIIAGLGVTVNEIGDDVLVISANPILPSQTISNAGVGVTLVSTGVGPDYVLKTIEGGTNVTVTSGVLDGDVSLRFTSIWEQDGDYIYPTSAITSIKLCGFTSTNTLLGFRSCIVGGGINTLAATVSDSVMLGAGSCNMNITVASEGICMIAGSQASTLSGTGQRNVMLGGTSLTLNGSNGSSGNALISGNLNVLNGSVGGDSIILGGSSNTLNTNATTYTTLIAASASSQIVTSDVQICAILGSSSSTLDGSLRYSGVCTSGPAQMTSSTLSSCNAILSSSSNPTMTGQNYTNCLIAGTGGTRIIGNVDGVSECLITAVTSTFIDGSLGHLDTCSILATATGVTFSLRAGDAGGGRSSAIMTSRNNTSMTLSSGSSCNALISGDGTTMNITSGTSNVVACGLNCTLGLAGNNCENCVILTGITSRITGNVSDSIASGVSATAAHSNSFIWSDGTNLTTTTTAPNQYIVAASAGSFVYSNSLRTTGVSLAAGSSSWGAVCDRDKKENLQLVAYSDIMDKLASIPVYRYNYIGAPASRWDIGPIAQDWHAQYCLDMMEVNGEPVEPKPTTQIELKDMCGVLLACAKSLWTDLEQMEALLTAA